MAGRLWNWRLWAGFGIGLFALLGFGAYIALVSITRTIFWPCLLLFLVAAVLLISGLKRAFREPQSYRGKIAGPILAVLSLLIFGLFTFGGYKLFTDFPAANNAPQVGQRAPGFALVDTTGKNYSLAQLLSTPITDSTGSTRPVKGVLVFFYRGYW
jgi:hypothetical protein